MTPQYAADNGVLQVENIKVNALMLRAVDYLENDKILTLLTAENGIVTAGIKGVKKAGAKLKFAAQPFCFAEYVLAEKDGRYTVVQADECESFYELRLGVEKYYAASAVCEAALASAAEGESARRLFTCAVRALTQMCDGDEGLALIEFILSALGINGYRITLSPCATCSSPLIGAARLRFDMDAGRFTCWDCGYGAGVGGETYSALLAAGGSHLPVTAFGKKRAVKLLAEYFAYKTDVRLKSAAEYAELI